MKPHPGAWRFRYLTSMSPALRKPWTTIGGMQTSVPAPAAISSSLLDLDRELALEHVEEIVVLEVDVAAGAVATRAEARPRGVRARRGR